MALRATLRRWHMWLGWLVIVPMLFWTVSASSWWRGRTPKCAAPPCCASPRRWRSPLPPIAAARSRPARRQPDARAARRRAALGHPLRRRAAAQPPGRSRHGAPARAYGAAEAQREVLSRYTGTARVAAVTRVDAGQSRRSNSAARSTRGRCGWSDGTHFYVDAGSGEIVARRTRFWRLYDFMWGLHIMDLQGRNQTNNPWVVTFSLLALVMTLMALVLLPLATRKGSRIKPPSSSTTPPPRDLRRDGRRPAGSRGSAPGCSARP